VVSKSWGINATGGDGKNRVPIRRTINLPTNAMLHAILKEQAISMAPQRKDEKRV
jgi:hypothetical protein